MGRSSAERELDQWLERNGYGHARIKAPSSRVRRAHATVPATTRTFRLIERHLPTDVGGRIDVTIIEAITPHNGGVTVDRHVKGVQEGRHVDDRQRKFYPGVTMEKAVGYRQRGGYTEVT